MRKIWVILLSVFVLSSLSGCEQSQQEETQAETVVAVGINLQEEESSEDQTTETENKKTTAVQETLMEEEISERAEDTDMKLYFDETEISVNWDNCKAVGELKEEAANGDITSVGDNPSFKCVEHQVGDCSLQ